MSDLYFVTTSATPGGSAVMVRGGAYSWSWAFGLVAMSGAYMGGMVQQIDVDLSL
jgi:hypothetical protein